jgi:hypothetical protein|tara:strand:- start:410 stop:634 length:225 start_codon:yes stop_codon:yes gene_type:complete
MSWIGNIIKSIFNNEGIGDNSQKPEEKHISEKKVNLKSMTKKQLETYGRTVGVELDRRHNKAKLIATLEDAIAS